jgi:hypothetical protein
MNQSIRHTPRRSVVALAIVLLGVFLVIPSPTATGGSAGSAGGSLGAQRFLLLGTDPTVEGPPETVLAFGPIHAKGSVTNVSDTKDIFVFPDGTLTVTHRPKSSGESFDPVTCLFRFRERGTYRITGGTGAYEDASGKGNYRVKGLGVACDETALPEVFMLRIFAKGSIHL